MPDPTTGRLRGATVAVTGASGNLGTALLRRLTDAGAAEIRGLSRRAGPDTPPYEQVRWYRADLGEDAARPTLARFVDGADAVVHLAWALQPGRHPEALRRVNVEGTRRVARAAADAGVAQFVHLSSLGAYAGAPVGHEVSEDWPTTGVPTSQYSRDKAAAERVVHDVFDGSPTTLTVARPTLVLQPEAASEIGRYFLGPLLLGAARALPGPVARHLPAPLPDLAVGFVHADDVAAALAAMLDRRAAGAFNLAAEPTLDAAALARTLGVRRLPVPAPLVRAALSAAFAAHLVPTEPGWLDLGIRAPALDTARARRELDWSPAHRGDDVLAQFVAALGRGAGATGPLLHPAGGPQLDPAGDPANTPGEVTPGASPPRGAAPRR